jgi:transposase InsO family protein
MLGNRSRPRIPLPKQWPKEVRSGVLHTISLAHFSLTFTRSWAANGFNARIRLKAENDRLRQELALLQEEMRIEDSRMLRIPAQRRASWMGRLDEEGPRALVQTREPVNKFSDVVAYIVRRLKVLCPTMGKAKIAQVLCRIGLHLGSTTVQRALTDRSRPEPARLSSPIARVVTARHPNHVWHCDLSTVPTSLGFWTSWFPCIDHYSRRIMGIAVFEQQPSSVAIRTFIGRATRRAGATPRHLITDQGKQFRDKGFRRWCRRRGINQRFGAVGKYGSSAIVERVIRTLKNECTRRLLVPYRRRRFQRELSLYFHWYSGHRPHDALEVRTPEEIYFGLAPACLAPRYEPRRKWPRGSPCAGPQAEARGRCGQRLELSVRYLSQRKNLPLVELRPAA